MDTQKLFIQKSDLYCFVLLFNIETFLRTLVRWELRGLRGASWRGLVQDKIQKISDERQEQEKQVRYLDIRKSGFLSYLNLSELKDIILGPLWEPCIKGKWAALDLLSADFKKLIAIRNKIAHFRPVTKRDTRIIKRFAEDLADWTRHYKQKREYAYLIDFDQYNNYKILSSNGLEAVKEYLSDIDNHSILKKYRLIIKIIDHHICISTSVTGGSVDPLAFERFMSANEKNISFCRIGSLGEKLYTYLPLQIGDKKVFSILEKQVELTSKEVEGFSSEDVLEVYKLAEIEGVLLESAPIPMEFNYNYS